MNVKALVSIVSLIGMVGCVSISSSEPARLSASDIGKVKETVKMGLRDPNSAEFTNISAQERAYSDGSTNTMICGLVNSRNGFGGYAGYTAFSIIKDKAGKFSLGAIDSSNDLGIARHGHCQTFALP